MRVTRGKNFVVQTSTRRPVRVGSIVRVTRVPPDYSSYPAETRRVLKAIVGHRFRVAGITVGKLHLLELNVGRLVDHPPDSVGNTVWLEPECVA